MKPDDGQLSSGEVIGQLARTDFSFLCNVEKVRIMQMMMLNIVLLEDSTKYAFFIQGS